MTDRLPDYSPFRGRVQPRQSTPGEFLFEFRRQHDHFRCELRDHGEWGVEAQFFQNDGFFYSRRHATREVAIEWATAERKDLEAFGPPLV